MMSALRLQNKVCIVTGSSSGLGRAIALGYAREGALLVCADLRPEARHEVEEEQGKATDEAIREKGGRAIFVKTDVSKSDEVQALVAKTVAEYGRLDVLVNNAGICVEAGRSSLRIHETSEDDWDQTMTVNAKSVFLGCKHAIAQMMRQDTQPFGDRGWIINMSSVFGLVGGRYNCSYVASKAAIANLTRQVAIDYADVAIHCNAINPGYTDTAIIKNRLSELDDAGRAAVRVKHPLHGIGTPEDIVGAAIFLASSESRWITGVNLPVDGGFTAQ